MEACWAGPGRGMLDGGVVILGGDPDLHPVVLTAQDTRSSPQSSPRVRSQENPGHCAPDSQQRVAEGSAWWEPFLSFPSPHYNYGPDLYALLLPRYLLAF